MNNRALVTASDDSASPNPSRPATSPSARLRQSFRAFVRLLRGGRNGETSPREMLEDLIEERGEAEAPLDENERTLLTNVLRVRDLSAEDVMVPRADIVAVQSKATFAEVVEIMTEHGHSRLPVYRESLDDAIGMVHIRDILAWREAEPKFQVSKITRPVLFVAPSMEVLKLLLEMRVTRCHMALVVDEFGGIDGLITIEDLVEEIVGEIEDEHDVASDSTPEFRPDGSFDADARVPLHVLETAFGPILSEEEREEIDTLGGLVAALAGRVPIRGELISHTAGIEFEVLEADPRRIRRLRVRGPRPQDGTPEQPGVDSPGGAAVAR